MKQLAILFALCLLLASTPFNAGASAKTIDTVRVSGVISVRMGLNDEAMVVGVAVVFESAGKEYQTLTTDAGTYSIDIPSGTYTLRTSKYGFCSTTRASIKARTSSPSVINLFLYPCAIVNSFQVDVSRERAGESCRYNDPLDTDTFEIRGAGNASRDLVIRYGVRKSSNDRVVYQRPAHPDQVIHQVVASYDTFTVYADGAEYDSTRHRLELRGNVLFDVNGVRTTAAAATIDITPEDVVIRQRS